MKRAILLLPGVAQKPNGVLAQFPSVASNLHEHIQQQPLPRPAGPPVSFLYCFHVLCHARSTHAPFGNINSEAMRKIDILRPKWL